MSAMNFQPTFTPRPPEKGSFPLDHEGECKINMIKYMMCLRNNDNLNSKCRHLAKDYLECRMNRNLMRKEEWTKLGMEDVSAGSQPCNYMEDVCERSKRDDEVGDSGEGQSHQDVMEMIQKELTELVTSDPLLKDLPAPLTLEEINSLIALEYGQAMTVNVTRADGQVMPVIVKQSATVFDLKRAIKRSVELKQMRSKSVVHISWRYTWKSYWLYFQGQKLDRDHKLLKDYGIGNRDAVTFLKRLREKR